MRRGCTGFKVEDCLQESVLRKVFTDAPFIASQFVDFRRVPPQPARAPAEPHATHTRTHRSPASERLSGSVDEPVRSPSLPRAHAMEVGVTVV
jgi:hypothetical protein